MTDLRRNALGLGRRGLAVFACRPRDKVPMTPRGCNDATTDEGRIDDMWRRWPDANIGIATGRPSGVFVLDIDGEDGEAALRCLEDEHGALPATIEAITGRGRHLYWRMPRHADIRNSAGKLGIGLDIRGSGGYCLSPPSVHPSGRRYSWSVDSGGTFADPPAWLIERLARPPGGASATPTEDWRALIVDGAGEGTRNSSIARLAGLLFRRIDPLVACELVICWNQQRCRPPLPDAELKRTLDSVAARELRRIGGGA
jgi:hypothetical protein